MSIERRLARKERREERKEAKRENKENIKARKRGEVFETTTNEATTLNQQILTTSETSQALDGLQMSAIDIKINLLCTFSTYGELLQKLNDAESLLLTDKKAKHFGLGKSGKKGVKDVSGKSKLYLERIRDRRKRVEKEKHPYSEQLPIAEKTAYLNAMRPIQSEIRNLQYDKASGFTNIVSSQAHGDVSDTKNTRKTIDRTKKIDQYKQELNKLLNKAVVIEAFDNKLDYANTFLTNAIHGNLTQADMIFYNTHQQQLNTALAGTDFPVLIQDAYHRCSVTPGQYRNGFKGIGSLKGKPFTEGAKNGLFGMFKRCLDSGNGSNATNNKIANLLTLGAMAFSGWGLWKIASKNSKSGRETAGRLGLGTAVGALVSQYATGKGLVENIKGIFYGGDNFLSRLFNCVGDWIGGENSPDTTTTTNGTTQDLLNNFYQQYDHNNQVLTLPMMFPGATIQQVEQSITAFEQNPTTWTQFRQNFLLAHQNTISGAVADTYLSEQFNRPQFIMWLQSLGVTIPASPEHQNDKIEDLMLQNFIVKSLNDNGYQIATGKTPAELVQYLETNKITGVSEAFKKLEEVGLITKGKEDNDTNPQLGSEYLSEFFQQQGYKIKTGKTMEDISNYLNQDTIKEQIEAHPESTTLIIHILTQGGLIEKAETTTTTSTPSTSIEDTDIIEPVEGETPIQTVARLKPIRKEHLDKCNNLSEAHKNAVLSAMENLVKNDDLAQKYGISIEDGRFNIGGNRNPVSGYNYEKFVSIGEETHLHLEKHAIDDYEDVNGNEIQANSYEELIGTAHFINKIRSKYKKREQKNFTLATDNTLLLNGYRTEFKLPQIPFIIDHKNDFIRSLNDSSGLLSTKVG